MSLRTTLIGAMAVAITFAVPPAAVAEPPQSATSSDLAGQAARMAVLDRFYVAVTSKDESALAELLDGAMIWIGGRGVRFVRPTTPGVPGAVFQSVFGPGVDPFENFEASASLYLPSGSQVVVLGQYAGYRRSSDEVLNTDFAHVFTFADDRLVHFQPFTETPAVIEGANPD